MERWGAEFVWGKSFLTEWNESLRRSLKRLSEWVRSFQPEENTERRYKCYCKPCAFWLVEVKKKWNSSSVDLEGAKVEDIYKELCGDLMIGMNSVIKEHDVNKPARSSRLPKVDPLLSTHLLGCRTHNTDDEAYCGLGKGQDTTAVSRIMGEPLTRIARVNFI